MRWGAWLIVLVGLAGCVDPGTSTKVPTPAPEASSPGTWSYCGDDAGPEVAPGVCARGFSDPSAAIAEPAIAVHPRDGRILAVGVNRHDPAGFALDLAQGQPVQGVDTEVWFTEDAGATWRASRPPPVPGPVAPTEVDPSLAFDANGTLHYTALAEVDFVNNGRVYYTSTRDLGATWTEPVLLVDDDRGTTDRNWLTLAGDGRIFVVWQQFPAGSGAAWSRDGTTWEGLDELLPCVGIGPVVEHQGEILTTCEEFTSAPDAPPVRVVYALGADGAAEERWRGERVCDWGFLLSTNETLRLACTEGWSLSGDGGRSWSEPVDLREVASIEDGWPRADLFAVAVDRAGRLHALVTGRDTAEVPYAAEMPPEERVAHVVLDGGLALLHEARLTPEGVASRRVPTTPMPSLADHYFGIAATSDGVALAWTRDRGIDVAYASPG